MVETQLCKIVVDFQNFLKSGEGGLFCRFVELTVWGYACLLPAAYLSIFWMAAHLQARSLIHLVQYVSPNQTRFPKYIRNHSCSVNPGFPTFHLTCITL